MPSRRLQVLSALAFAAAAALPAGAQSVISARSGVVHYFEGSVYVNDQLLEPHLGRFPMLSDGAQLRTGQGRVEVLLTPGVFLRLGENSAIRLDKTDLTDTRVELTSGSAMIDCTQTAPGPAVTLAFRQWNMHFADKGLYRIDVQPPVLWVRSGKAEVAAANQAPVTVGPGSSLPFADVLVPDQSAGEPDDALSDWSIGRRQSIMADDAIAAQIDQDPGSGDGLMAGGDGFTNFPLIGIPTAVIGTDAFYDVYRPYQAGFSSIYLPGYRYRPFAYPGFTGGVYRSPYSYGTGVLHSPGLYGPPRHTGGMTPIFGGRMPASVYAPAPRPAMGSMHGAAPRMGGGGHGGHR